MASTSLLVLLATLLSGGSDLLDYLPSHDYWQAKGVTVTVDSLLKDLEPPQAGADISGLVTDLASAKAAVRDAASVKIVAMGPGVVAQLLEATKADDPELAHRARELIDRISRSQKAAEVRRLMAIRTLGEMKAKEAAPALQRLVKSNDPFVADYAQAALAAIDGKAYERPHAASSDDAWLLPDKTRMVWHLSCPGGKPIDYDAVIKLIPHDDLPADGQAGGGPAGQDPAAVRKAAAEQFLTLAEKVGNIRLDGITVGVSGEIGQNQGYVIVIVHGRYDVAAVAELMNGLKEGIKETTVVNGATVYRPSEEAAFFFPTKDRAVFVAGPGGGNVLPIEEMVTAAGKGSGGLKAADGMVKLIKGIDTKQPLWGVVDVTDSYRQADFIAPFDTITLIGKANGAKLDFRFDGKGTDADKVRSAVGQVNAGLDEFRQTMKQMTQDQVMPAGMQPTLRMAAEVTESIKCRAEGKEASLTGSVPAEGPGLFMMGGLFGLRASAAIDPAPNVAPNPPPAPPE